MLTQFDFAELLTQLGDCKFYKSKLLLTNE